MEASGSSTRPATADGKGRRRTSREQARLLAVALLVALAAAFALLNFRHVRVNFIVASGHPPLIVVIVACLAVGIAIGLAGGRQSTRRKG